MAEWLPERRILSFPHRVPTMHLMYYTDPNTGKRVYTLKKVNAATGKATTSAHPGE